MWHHIPKPFNVLLVLILARQQHSGEPSSPLGSCSPGDGMLDSVVSALCFFILSVAGDQQLEGVLKFDCLM